MDEESFDPLQAEAYMVGERYIPGWQAVRASGNQIKQKFGRRILYSSLYNDCNPNHF